MSSGGSDWIAGSGKAVKVDGGYRISARKVFTSGAEAGDLLMTGAVVQTEGEPDMVIHFPVLDEGAGSEDPRHLAHARHARNRLERRLIEGLFVPDASVAVHAESGEWHPLFQIIATIAFPLIYSVYLGVAESARDIAIELAKGKRPTHHAMAARRRDGYGACAPRSSRSAG